MAETREESDRAGLDDCPGPHLCVVIPTRNRCAQVVRLVTALVEDPMIHQLVVVDDASTDDTHHALSALAATHPRLQVLQGPGKGASPARITGAQQADGEIVLFLDDDVTPEPGLFAGHLARHAAGRPLVVVGYMPTHVPVPPTPTTFSTALYAHEYEGRCEKYDADPSSVLLNLWMGNVSMPRETFLEATARWPTPPSRFGHEDQQVGLRLRQMGVDAVFDRSLSAVHEHKRTLAQFRRDSRRQGAGRAVLEEDHSDQLDITGPAQFRAGLPMPVRAFVAATSSRAIYRTGASTLTAMVRYTGAAGSFGVQTAAARLLRRVEQQHGYLERAATTSDGRAL
jgi:GT2 family glycosyltransferase